MIAACAASRPNAKAGVRGDDQQQRRERKDREIGNRGGPAQGFIFHESGNRIFDQVPELRAHLRAVDCCYCGKRPEKP
jgi:hypothetical protein